MSRDMARGTAKEAREKEDRGGGGDEGGRWYQSGRCCTLLLGHSGLYLYCFVLFPLLYLAVLMIRRCVSHRFNIRPFGHAPPVCILTHMALCGYSILTGTPQHQTRELQCALTIT